MRPPKTRLALFLFICGMAAAARIGAAARSGEPQAATPAAPPTIVTMTLPGTIVQQYTSVKDLWIKTANAMPAESYAFQPMPDMRTFAGGMGHILASDISQCSSLIGRKHALSGVDLEKTLTTKADTVRAVADTFAFCDEYFLKVGDSTPIADAYVNMNGRRNGEPVVFKVSNGASIVHFLTHNNEMYGYLAVYMRLKGIVPPSSVRVTAGSGRDGRGK
jgi:hypothetical protein